MTRYIGIFVASALLATGLALSGMTQPVRVVGFFDVTGTWDPSLALVMVGAISVYFVAFRLVLKRERPIFAERFGVPTRKDIDKRLVLGALTFGVGWALSGFCPGTAITSLGSGSVDAMLFAGMMIVGMWLNGAWERSRARRATGTSEAKTKKKSLNQTGLARA